MTCMECPFESWRRSQYCRVNRSCVQRLGT
ncbi:hypothetical protein IVB31_13675 [Bradyrhizobium sp. 21]|nr:hypothetical protein [Bradyrhizobium sp. 21]